MTRLLVDARAELLVREVVDGLRSRTSRTRPCPTSASSAATVSSSLRPLACRTLSRSKDRPMTAAAPSTCRATSPSPPSRASRRPRTSGAASPPPAHSPRAEPRGIPATNRGRPSLSRYTRCSRSGAEGCGCAACTSVATSSSSSRAGLTIVPRPSRDRSTASRRSRWPGGTPSLRQASTSSSARPSACGLGRRSRRVWPRPRHARRRGTRCPARGPAGRADHGGHALQQSHLGAGAVEREHIG